VLWTEAGHLMLRPMSPQVFDGIEFGCVGRQKLQLDIAACVDVIADQTAATGLQKIPNDEEFAAGELAAEIFEEGDKFGSANRAVDELEIDFQNVTPATAESGSQVKLYCSILPLGAQTRCGRSLTPDSSTKTRVRPCLA
jgi:hypothetical protein